MRLAAEITLIVVAGAGAAACLAALVLWLPAGPSVFEERTRPRVKTEPWPAQLVRLERTVGWSSTNAADAHARLRPVLIEIADARLARRGLSLGRDGAAARQLLGPPAWELVRPGRPAPAARDAPGVTERELDEILDALEAV